MLLLLLDHFLELSDGLGSRNFERKCLSRIIALNPTEEKGCAVN
jgi:hypothetical protein